MTHTTLGERLHSEHLDPGTAEDSSLDRLEPVDARTLCLARESDAWDPRLLDFTSDRREWAALDLRRRAEFVDALAPVFCGLERAATLFASFVATAADGEPDVLNAQVADEAAHTVLFARLWSEVFVDEAADGAAVTRARARCDQAFADLFDPRARQTMQRLRADPNDAAARIESVVMHHLVVKGLLGLTAAHFAHDYLQRASLLRGVSEGLAHLKRDEHRHVAWATWFLRARALEAPSTGGIVQSALMDLLPVVVSVLIEGGMAACCEGLDSSEFLGYSSADLNYYALMALVRRLRVIGGETTEVQQFAASGAWRASRLIATGATAQTRSQALS